MARTTHVKKAQARFHTKPVLDDQGNPVKIALTRKDGSPKTTSAKKGSRPIFITKTVADKSRPKPLHKCDKCHQEIQVGSPYKWIKPKSGPYGGRLMVRCGTCPGWQVWDYSSSLSAQVARIENDATTAAEEVDDPSDVETLLSDAAEAIKELAEQKREGASNIEEGFGHPTSMSEELEGMADELESWADEVEATEVPDQGDHPNQDEVDCDECQGTGQVDNPDYDEADEADVDQMDCDECGGIGQVEDEDPDVDLEAWREAVQEAVSDALGNCPV